MHSNIAIFYDIENLIGGYAKAQLLPFLSLPKIINEVQTRISGRISVQRAYADWSDTRLAKLYKDLSYIALTPVQVIGIRKNSIKIPANVQIAVDAMDLVLKQPSVKTVVLVSGDGGLTSLAGKLREYGYFVVCCAYAHTLNRYLRNSCNDYIHIEMPNWGVIDLPSEDHLNQPVFSRFREVYQPVRITNTQQLTELALEVLEYLINYESFSTALTDTGLNVGLFLNLYKYRIHNIDYRVLGFTRSMDMIRYILRDSKCKLIFKEPSDYRLVFKDVCLEGWNEIDPVLEMKDLHTVENYKEVLNRGEITFAFPSPEMIIKLSKVLFEKRMRYRAIPFEQLHNDVCRILGDDEKEIKNGLRCFVSSGCFLLKPEKAKFSEQYLYFLCQTELHAAELLREAMLSKLEEDLKEVDEELFSELFPPIPTSPAPAPASSV